MATTRRDGQARGALPVLLAALPALALLAAGRLAGGTTMELAAGYLLALPVLLAGLTLPPALPPLISALGIVVLAGVSLLTGAPVVSASPVSPVAPLLLLAAPSLFQALCGALAWFTARQMRTLRRSVTEAEATTEVALADAARARNDASQRLQLEEGLRPLVHMLSEAAEGKGNIRVPPARPSEALILGSLRAALEAQVRRGETLARAEDLLRREREAATGLAKTLCEAAREAKRPEWPEPANLPLDAVVAALRDGGFSCVPAQRSRLSERGDEPGVASGPLFFTRPHSGVLPPPSGSLPPRPGSGAPPGSPGTNPLFERLHSGPLPPRPMPETLPTVRQSQPTEEPPTPDAASGMLS